MTPSLMLLLTSFVSPVLHKVKEIAHTVLVGEHSHPGPGNGNGNGNGKKKYKNGNIDDVDSEISDDEEQGEFTQASEEPAPFAVI